MTVQSRSERRFDRSSPVARYWLAQCEGFHVRGPVNGTVEKVVGSVAEQTAEALVVRAAWRRHHIPVDAIDAVVPAARLIVLDDPGSDIAPARRHRTRSLARASSHAAGTVAATVADKGPPLARLVRDAVMVLALVVAAGIMMVFRALGIAVVRVTQLVARTGAPPATRKPPP